MNNATKITFEELKELDGESIEIIKPYKVSTEPARGLLKINGTNVFGCFNNQVSCENDSFAFIHFYDMDGEEVANVSVFNVKNECLVIVDGEEVYSETAMRVMFNDFKKD